ncbi:hypothetical protein BS47DRAFT_1362773 [Hydnum rufescens UP504]|uniref:Uncharacterized protein n=1 Tax=Hydnum rufescens UP504 TaxID=1448309 RepID=A0A9P6AW37_9AGAM|nr:hypothetical protein BS47DRAFT_1362773 [Hydnum rufescens UP504]
MCSVGIPLLLAFEASLTHGAGYHIDTYLHDKNAKRLALFCGGELFCFIHGLAKTWGNGFGSWSNHCGASEPPTPQPEDFQMRGTPQSSIPQSSVPQSSVPQSSIPQSFVPQSFIPQLSIPHSSIPKSALPQSSLLQSSFSPSLFPQLPFPQSSFLQPSVPPSIVPTINLSPLGATVPPSFRL